MEENVNLEQETEIIKTVKDEYEAKLLEQKNEYETKLEIMRKEHAEQLRTILRTGEVPDKEDAQKDEEMDEVESEVARICAKYKK